MFLTECANRLSARDSFEEAVAEAQYNWDEFGLSSSILRGGRLVATFDGAGLRRLVRL